MQATIKAENGEYSALIGDKPIGDFVKEWTGSDAGKHFVSADNNSGGGANGGGSNGTTKTMTRASYNALSTSNPAQAAAFFKDGGQLTD
jgi:hypothetical protein